MTWSPQLVLHAEPIVELGTGEIAPPAEPVAQVRTAMVPVAA